MEFTIIINVLNLHEIEYFEMTMKGIVVYTPFTCFCCMLLMVSTKPTKVAPLKNGGEIGIATKTLIQNPFDGGCRKYTVRRHVGDKQRNCTSLKPVKFSVCTGYCIPQYYLNQYTTNFEKVIEETKHDYVCAESKVKQKLVKVFCADDNTTTVYSIKNVKTCSCNKRSDTQRTKTTFMNFK